TPAAAPPWPPPRPAPPAPGARWVSGGSGSGRAWGKGSVDAVVDDGARPGAQVEDGLRVQLAHPALRDAEDRADLGEGQPLVVVEADDDPLALGQGPDGVGEALLHLRDLVGGKRSGGRVAD